MKEITQYINDIEQSNSVNEGRIWDSIKGWFKNLFSSNNNKKWNRFIDDYYYDDEFDDMYTSLKGKKYKEHLTKEFNKNKSKIQIKKISKDDFKKIMNLKTMNIDEETNSGFWKFTDYIENIDIKDNDDSNYRHIQFFIVVYTDNETQDIPCMMACKDRNVDWLVIKRLQIIKEFQNLLPIKDVINILMQQINTSVFGVKNKGDEYTKIMVYEDDEKELYNTVINDCKFSKRFDNKIDGNLAEKELHT